MLAEPALPGLGVVLPVLGVADGAALPVLGVVDGVAAEPAPPVLGVAALPGKNKGAARGRLRRELQELLTIRSRL